MIPILRPEIFLNITCKKNWSEFLDSEILENKLTNKATELLNC